jgi:hypothetical protein
MVNSALGLSINKGLADTDRANIDARLGNVLKVEIQASVTKLEVFLARSLLHSKNKKAALQRYTSDFVMQHKQDPAKLVTPMLWSLVKQALEAK